MRLRSIDYLRSAALLVIVFLHSALLNPPGIISLMPANRLISLLLYGSYYLVGGLFIIMSGIVNTVSSISRLGLAPQFEKRVKGMSRSLVASGVFLLLFHFIYTICTAPAAVSPGSDMRSAALLPLLIRIGTIPVLDMHRLFESTILSTVAWNLIFMSLLWRTLFSRRMVLEHRLQYPVLIVLSGLIFIFAVMNPASYTASEKAYVAGNYSLAMILGFFLDRPFPVYPYTSFAFIGMIMGFLMFEKRPRRYLLGILLGGIAALSAGIHAFLLSPPGIGAIIADWKTRILLETGFYLTIPSLFMIISDLGKNALTKPVGEGNRVSRVFRSFGMAALTIIFLETPICELMNRLWDRFRPGWETSLEDVLYFSLSNVALWALILSVWKTLEYRGTLDHIWSGIMHAAGRKSARFNPASYDKTGKFPL